MNFSPEQNKKEFDFSEYEIPTYLRVILGKGEYVSSEDAKAL